MYLINNSMKDKVIDLYYTIKYSILNSLDTVKFGAEDLYYSVKSKFEKIDNVIEEDIEEVKPVKKKKKATKKKKK